MGLTHSECVRFLEGEADCVQYYRLPNCLDYLKIQIIGNVYVEKVWNDKFNAILNEMCLECCPWDPCLYFGGFTACDSSSMKLFDHKVQYTHHQHVQQA